MSEAVPDRRLMRFISGALALLRALFVIASRGLIANPMLAQVSSMPQGCAENMEQADVGTAHQRTHQMTCSRPGSLATAPAGTLWGFVTPDIHAAVSFVAEGVFSAGRVIAPGSRPPITNRL